MWVVGLWLKGLWVRVHGETASSLPETPVTLSESERQFRNFAFTPALGLGVGIWGLEVRVWGLGGKGLRFRD